MIDTPAADYVNVYDFDHTIYRGDCTLDFYFFCILKNPLLLYYVPFQMFHFFLFKIGLEERTKFKSNFFIFLRGINNLSDCVDKFWEKHFSKIRAWYLKLDHRQDIIVSASPEFLIEPVSRRLRVQELFATKINERTGKIVGKNCYGEEKVVRIEGILKSKRIQKAYTDHLSDLPILLLAEEPFIVRGERITKYDSDS